MLSPKEVVNKWVDAFNDGDVDMIISLYDNNATNHQVANCLLYTSPSPRDRQKSRMPTSA